MLLTVIFDFARTSGAALTMATPACRARRATEERKKQQHREEQDKRDTILRERKSKFQVGVRALPPYGAHT